jgi:hypothetical protein
VYLQNLSGYLFRKRREFGESAGITPGEFLIGR